MHRTYEYIAVNCIDDIHIDDIAINGILMQKWNFLKISCRN